MGQDLIWCTYSWIHRDRPQGIGKVFRKNKNSCEILYSEEDLCGVPWNNNYVQFFSILEDAIIFMLENNRENTVYNIQNNLEFSEKSEINWKKMKRYETNLIYSLSKKEYR